MESYKLRAGRTKIQATASRMADGGWAAPYDDDILGAALWIKETVSKWKSDSSEFEPVLLTYRKIAYRD